MNYRKSRFQTGLPLRNFDVLIEDQLVQRFDDVSYTPGWRAGVRNCKNESIPFESCEVPVPLRNHVDGVQSQRVSFHVSF